MLNEFINIINEKSDNEKKNFKTLFNNVDKKSKILDVGCGFGRNLIILKKLGFNKLYGVDVKEESIEKIKDEFNVFSTNELKNKIKKKSCDVILLSHIVEHFAPADLLKFIENYLGYLKEGGFLYISTPLYSKRFYDDFDHVRPYHLDGFLMVFTNEDRQIQFKSNYQLKLQNMYFRNSALALNYYRCKYIKSYNKLPILINILFVFLYLISFKIIGKKTGWQAILKLETIKATINAD